MIVYPPIEIFNFLEKLEHWKLKNILVEVINIANDSQILRWELNINSKYILCMQNVDKFYAHPLKLPLLNFGALVQ